MDKKKIEDDIYLDQLKVIRAIEMERIIQIAEQNWLIWKKRNNNKLHWSEMT